MKNTLVSIRNNITGAIYRHLLKKLFFLKDPEYIHDHMVKIGARIGHFAIPRHLLALLFSYHHPSLTQNILGITFQNPVGLSAGFDKNAQLTQVLPSIGFGFQEIGSITGKYCAGNPTPRLWRLKDSKSLVVYYGLKNEGCETISKRLSQLTFSYPIGINIAKTNNEETCDTMLGIQDYIKAYRAFEHIGDYYTINISCPNTFGGQPFTDPQKLAALLTAIDSEPVSKPIFLKLSPDLSNTELDQILDVVQKHKINGFVISNLTKNRNNSKIVEKELPDHGGLSGKVVEELANNMIKYVYTKTHGKHVIIGCGGIFSAEDAYNKIKNGASLVELITGMIFQGPQLISEINQGLVKLLKKDGYTNISEAIGSNCK